MNKEGRLALVSAGFTLVIQLAIVAIANYWPSREPDGSGCENGAHANIHNCSIYEAVELIFMQVVILNIGSIGLLFFFVWLVVFIPFYLVNRHKCDGNSQR